MIAHHNTLTFDMRMSNIGVNRRMLNNVTKASSATTREPRKLHKDGRGKSQDNYNRQNQNMRISDSSNDDSLLGKPNGNIPGVVNVVVYSKFIVRWLCWE